MEPMNNCLKIAPPQKAAQILASRGYPLGEKLIRRLAVQKTIPATWTGRKWLISIEGTINVLENGEPSQQPAATAAGQIRKIEE
ncbi:MAG: hypothetical protein ACK5L3_08690 [Oscillospiraceae bacterium]